MKGYLIGFAIAIALAGCSYGGHYARSGPCEGWATDHAACLRGDKNAKAIAGVQSGQSMATVRSVMGEPEQRDVSTTDERWRYLTDYRGDLLTEIVFVGGVVSAIKQIPVP